MNWSNVIPVIQGLAGALALLAGAVVTWRKATRESEDAEWHRLAAHMDRQDHKLELLEKRLDASVVRERIRDDYIQILRLHIANGHPPPPPPWPDALTNTGN